VSRTSGEIQSVSNRGKTSRAWFAYAVAGGVLTLALALSAAAVLSGAALQGVWLSAGVAYGLQLVAFALLLHFRDQAGTFMIGWVAGMMLRFLALFVFTLGVTKYAAYPAAPLLLGLVGFIFVLVLLEPLFLRWDLR
jgi:hypothetical protein